MGNDELRQKILEVIEEESPVLQANLPDKVQAHFPGKVEQYSSRESLRTIIWRKLEIIEAEGKIEREGGAVTEDGKATQEITFTG